jgi:rubredoxin
MSHQLWNNNAQNEKDYGHSNLCPVCKTEKDLVIM